MRFKLSKEQPAGVESQRPFTVGHGARLCCALSVFLVGLAAWHSCRFWWHLREAQCRPLPSGGVWRELSR